VDDSPGGSDPGLPVIDDGIIDFEDPDTPQGAMRDSDLIVVADPDGNLPQTGGMTLYAATAFAAFTILMGLLAITNRKKEEELEDALGEA
jgi:LPXTG-motif cell wall-anchored protein